MTAVEKRTSVETATQAEGDPTRRWLVAAVVVLGAAVIVLGAWVAMDAGSGDDLGGDTTIVDQWADAFIQGDADAVASLFTENGIYEERGPAQAFGGTVAIRDQLDAAFRYGNATEMTPATVVVGNGLLAGRDDVIIVEWEMRGTSASGSRDPSDKTPFSVQAITLFEMEDGLISRSVFYADWADLFN